MVSSLSNGDHIMIAAYDSARDGLSNWSRNWIQNLGGNEIHSICYRCGYIFRGIVGRTDGNDDLVGSGS